MVPKGKEENLKSPQLRQKQNLESLVSSHIRIKHELNFQ